MSLYFTENDETLCKWRWLTVKQTGAKPCARSGISAVAVTGTYKLQFWFITCKDLNKYTKHFNLKKGTNIVRFFGGVQMRLASIWRKKERIRNATTTYKFR